MSSASKSKAKDKRAAKEVKTPSKSSATVNGGSGLPASAYNPLLGTFHTFEMSSQTLAPTLHANGRFRNIDDSDDHSGSTHGSGGDYDSASNNDSRSVESEEHNKGSNGPNKQEAIPGADNDKREKTRQKNERKHQRQKERRAQELHERCSGYLMSRKLEALAQQLVAMGFSHDKATMALILNEGRVEEAVAWLFEGGEDTDKDEEQNFDTGNNLKIDISEELARIADLEIKHKCSKQEVERVLVVSEGDMEKAEEMLRLQKHDQPSSLPKPEEISDPPTIINGKISLAVNQSNVRIHSKLSNSASLIPQRKDDRDFNYTKAAAATVGFVPKLAPKVVQPISRVLPKLEWARPQQNPEKRWPVGVGSSSSVSYSLAPPPVQVSSPPAKTEQAHYVPVSNEYKNIQPGTTLREPVVMMQRPQSINVNQSPVITSISSSPRGTGNPSWYPNAEMLKPNGFLPNIPSTRSLSPNDLSSNQFYHHPSQQYPQFIPGSTLLDNPNGPTNRANGSWACASTSPTLAAASSLGLFSGLGSSGCPSGSTSPVDWNTSGLMPSCDYTSIDWSLDRSMFPPKHNGLWVGGLGLGVGVGPYSSRNGGNIYDSGPSGLDGVNIATMRPSSSSNGNGVPILGGVQDSGAAKTKTGDSSSGGGSREWTSPFEGKDLFSLPRQFVSSPSL